MSNHDRPTEEDDRLTETDDQQLTQRLHGAMDRLARVERTEALQFIGFIVIFVLVIGLAAYVRTLQQGEVGDGAEECELKFQEPIIG